MHNVDYCKLLSDHYSEKRKELSGGIDKKGSVGGAILDAIGMSLLGAAAGGTIGGLSESDPHKVHGAMYNGAITGGSIGASAPILAKIIGSAGRSDMTKRLDNLRKFRDSSVDELLGKRPSGMM